MDDLIQWAMNTLDQGPGQQPPAAAAYSGGAEDAANSFPSLHALRNASQAAAGVGVGLQEPRKEQRANSWSSGDTGGGGNSAMEHDGWSPNSIPVQSSNKSMSWNFSAATAQPSGERISASSTRAHDHHHVELMYGAAAKRGGVVKNTVNAGSMSTSPYAQDHIIAERKRREKINQRFIELSTVIPGLKKMDKATILGDAVKYVKELQDKVKTLEDHSAKNIESVVLVKKPCFSTTSVVDADGTTSSTPNSKNSQSSINALPEIEARFSENSILVRVHCENVKGVLVKILSEIEELHLSITHTNVMPFPACTVIITLTAKVEEGFSISAEEIVRRLNSALHQQL